MFRINLKNGNGRIFKMILANIKKETFPFFTFMHTILALKRSIFGAFQKYFW